MTVTGPGGVGKTRLAGEVVARQAAARFADGAWLAELASVRDPARVAAAVERPPATGSAGALVAPLVIAGVGIVRSGRDTVRAWLGRR